MIGAVMNVLLTIGFIVFIVPVVLASAAFAILAAWLSRPGLSPIVGEYVTVDELKRLLDGAGTDGAALFDQEGYLK